MRTLLIRFRRDKSGATAIEYGLIAAGIAAAIILVVNTLGTNLNTTFSSISTAIKLRKIFAILPRAPASMQLCVSRRGVYRQFLAS